MIGFKDGAGDLDLMSRIVRAVRDAAGDEPFHFFNGMPTAEVTQRAYRAIGVPLYSSAAFAFAPRIALAYYQALEKDDQATLAAWSEPSTIRSPGCGARDRLRRVPHQGGRRARRVPVGGRAPAAYRGKPAAPGGAIAHPRRRDWRSSMKAAAITITRVTVTPIAFADPPLLTAAGVHEPFALRAIIEVATDAGLTGLGETYADEAHLAALNAAAAAIEGADAYHTNEIYRRVQAIAPPKATIAGGLAGDTDAVDRVFSPFEVACLDIQGKAAGRPVADLLGGAVRAEVPFSAYLFYKWAGHPGGAADDWGEALDPAGIVAQATKMVQTYGFTAIKLKGGVFPPEQEIEAVRALRAAFPGHPLRLDPNAAWTPATAIGVAQALDGTLEYLEDPTPGIAGMAEVARRASMPLATNMCVVAFGHLDPAIRQAAVQVILSDHHYWGGLRRSALLAGICDTFGVGPVDALQLPPGHQPRRDDPPRRRRAQPHLRLRHPLAVEDRGRRGRATRSPSPAAPSPCPAAPGSASSWTATPWPGCTSSTWPAACATAMTPATCSASTPATSASSRAGSRRPQLRAAGLIEDGYALTDQGQRLLPAIHALTRFGLARLRPLPGTAIAYRPSFAAYALRARADAAAIPAGTVPGGPFLSVTHVESESFCTRPDQHSQHGQVTTWPATPAASRPTSPCATRSPPCPWRPAR